MALLVWLVAYIFLIRFFMPMIRENSAARASSRAMVSGQVVDTITNIKTVKLFAHAAFEDRVALDAMEVFRDRSLEFGVHFHLVPVQPDAAGRGAARAPDRRHGHAVAAGTGHRR